MSSATKRFLICVWHTWGFWTVVLTPAALLAAEELSQTILIVAAGIWLLGLLRADERCEPTVLLRVTGLGVLGLAFFLFHPASEFLGYRQQVWRLHAMALLSGMLALGVIGIACASLAWLVAKVTDKERREQPRRGRIWVRQAGVFPLAVLVTMLMAQFRHWLAVLALALWAIIWLWHFLRDADSDRPVRLRLAGLGLALLLLAGWPPVSIDTNRDDIAEAVFRHQLFWAKAGAYYLEIDGGDPSEEFLRRFADLPVRIKAASEAQRPRWNGGDFDRSYVTDKETGMPGTIFRVESVRRSWKNPCTVAVKGGYYCGVLAASGNTYWVAWLGGQWTVVDEFMHWIS